MSDIRGVSGIRDVYYHDPAAPVPTVVVPSVFVAARDSEGRLLLVRRCDSGDWELPGGRVDVGEGAVAAATREVAEESGVVVHVTGLSGLYTDPRYIVRSVSGEVRQQFVVLFRASPVAGRPRADRRETSAAAWVAPSDIAGLPMQAPVRAWIRDALVLTRPPHVTDDVLVAGHIASPLAAARACGPRTVRHQLELLMLRGWIALGRSLLRGRMRGGQPGADVGCVGSPRADDADT